MAFVRSSTKPSTESKSPRGVAPTAGASVRVGVKLVRSASDPIVGVPSERVSRSGSSPRMAKSSRGAGPYKLLAIDLDGTLLDHAGEASPEDIVALKKLKARGIHVTILTGRLFSGARPAAKLIGIDGPVGCADGSHVVQVRGSKTLLHHAIRGRAAHRLRQSIEQNELVAFLFAEDSIVHDERGADYLPYVRTWSTDLRFARTVTEHPLWESKAGMTAVVAIGHEANIGRAVADLQSDCTQGMQVSMFPFQRNSEKARGHWAMIARASGGTKGTALAWMASHYGIKLSETVCVGDWLNDLPMLSTAGRSFAMGQSPDEVKKAATDTLTRSITTGGGIAEAVALAFGHG